MFASETGIGLTEPLEHEGQEIWGNAATGIADGDLNMRIHSRQPQLHLATTRRELDRVGQQIPDDLLEAIGVSGDGCCQRLNQRLHTYASGVRRWHNGRHRITQDPRQIHRLDVQAEPAGDDARDVEDILDDVL
jgi:hypothetical protein